MAVLSNGPQQQLHHAIRALDDDGFKIAVAHTSEEVNMLRDAYAIADSETRAIIRKMAEAVNAADGVPQRANQRRIL